MQPQEVLDVVVADGAGQLRFAGDDPPVAAFDDQVDLVLTPVGTEVPGGGLRSLGVDPHALRRQRLEECAEERAVPGDGDRSLVTAEEGAGAEAEEGGGQGRVDEVVLGGGGEPAPQTGGIADRPTELGKVPVDDPLDVAGESSRAKTSHETTISGRRTIRFRVLLTSRAAPRSGRHWTFAASARMETR